MKQAGILLHISSLPSQYGVGSLGKNAYKFVDFLNKSGQTIWQILPIGPTSYGDSPYSSTSAFAFNPYFIDLELLYNDGLIDKEDLENAKIDVDRVNFDYLSQTRFKLLNKAYNNADKSDKAFIKFCNEQAYWLDDYACYMIFKKLCDGKSWNNWYDDWKYHKSYSIDWLLKDHFSEVEEVKYIQYLFYKQWMKLKKYANKKNVQILGDMPIYCAYDSSDVWGCPSNYQLDENLDPTGVAGCPPDAFTADGQLWGNPLYDYDKMKKDKYSWWVKRVKHSLMMYDIVRIDHFRGFAGYYNIPFGDKTAKNGKWVTGPRMGLFNAINKAIPNAKIVAENLGFLTKDVYKLMADTNYPGMHIFQFELSNGKTCPLKKGFKENNAMYSGTHDNQTIMSFYNELSYENRELINQVCNIKIEDRPNLKIIEFCMKQNTIYTIIPFQDYLGLTDDKGRMNIPSTVGCNWSYISKSYDYSDELAEYILKITKSASRC